jgi:ADP-heptose:LPS heptosyltransferase
VVLETLPQFEPLFQNHYYPVLFPRQTDPRVLATAKRYNLTMSYESNPKQLHLKSYYDFCEVPEEERVIRNPKLNFVVDESIKLFKRYCVIHIDKRTTSTGRNVEGIDWSAVIWELEKNGLTPIQIGKGEHINTGALEMKTITQDLMCYLIAGCDLFIGCDSGPANIALATGRKMITFHGSVDPSYIYPDMTNVRVMTNHSKEKSVCENAYCWHSVIGCEGKKCEVNPELPPCTIYDTSELLNAINEMI